MGLPLAHEYWANHFWVTLQTDKPNLPVRHITPIKEEAINHPDYHY